MGALLNPTPPQPIIAPPPPTAADPAIALAGQRQRGKAKQAAGAEGFADTVKTGSAGLTQMATTTNASLLGG